MTKYSRKQSLKWIERWNTSMEEREKQKEKEKKKDKWKSKKYEEKKRQKYMDYGYMDMCVIEEVEMAFLFLKNFLRQSQRWKKLWIRMITREHGSLYYFIKKW